MRLAIDVGGTFTDLVVEAEGRFELFKTATTSPDPADGVIGVLELAASSHQMTLQTFLGSSGMFLHGTTHGINAILTGNVAKTILLTTKGHRDVLLLREGGRDKPFDFTRPYPDPYIPRSMTVEVDERIGSLGEVVVPLDEERLSGQLLKLQELDIAALAVCYLWSSVNPAHEVATGRLIEEHLPSVPYSLSHRVNPIIREYRRASSTAIDASLKPVMTRYLENLESRLRQYGFAGPVLIVTSIGGVIDAHTARTSPIHIVGSGPAMAPVAGRSLAHAELGTDTVIVTDAGGTTFDVSLVQRGRIPRTEESWVGPQYLGHMTGFPSVDVRSIGAGGGSIAYVDEAGLLHVGPRSAGAHPGPAAYGLGGEEPTLTDACIALGYLDPKYFLSGGVALDAGAAVAALEERVARPLGLDVPDSALAVRELSITTMVSAIEDLSVSQGVDPRGATLVSGGGAGGLNAVAIARQLGCERVLVPAGASTLSALGALLSELVMEFGGAVITNSDRFDFERVNRLLDSLTEDCRRFMDGAARHALSWDLALSATARYPYQVWSLDLPIAQRSFGSMDDVREVEKAFHRLHEEIFAISDPTSSVEILGWRSRIACRINDTSMPLRCVSSGRSLESKVRAVTFRETGTISVPVLHSESMISEVRHLGPAVIESPFTTVVLDPGAYAWSTDLGSIVITP